MKKVLHNNYRVVITPRQPGDYGFVSMSPRLAGYDTPEKIAQHEKDTCDQIYADVKRHIDNVGYVSVEHDVVEYCSYCKCLWDSSTTEAPFCCEEAIDEFNSNKLNNKK